MKTMTPWVQSLLEFIFLRDFVSNSWEILFISNILLFAQGSEVLNKILLTGIILQESR